MQNLTLMAITGGNAVSRIMAPYFEFLERIGIHFAPSPEDALKEILGKLREPIKVMISTIFLLGVIFFVYKAVLAGIPYFNADNPSERAQAKDKLINNLLGAAFCLSGVVIINLLLGAFGVSSDWEID